jgi:2,5-diamino-6-(ribosylamino)-4(3H)-pyrimidinone 5'-phosphate reductase
LIHSRPLLGDPSGDRPYLALNMVATVDGRAALNGSAVGIGSPADKHLMRELRAEADVVLHGAGTVRADPLSARVPHDMIAARLAAGLTEQPLGAIVTRSGNLPSEHPYYESPTVIYVVGDHDVPASPGSQQAFDVLRKRVRNPTVEIKHITTVSDLCQDLRARGVRRVLCEGGPTLNTALFKANLVDEIFLTIAPKLLGGEEPLTIVKGASLGVIHLELRSLVELVGELFLKYGVLGGKPKA